jgi:hypothetical protein
MSEQRNQLESTVARYKREEQDLLREREMARDMPLAADLIRNRLVEVQCRLQEARNELAEKAKRARVMVEATEQAEEYRTHAAQEAAKRHAQWFMTSIIPLPCSKEGDIVVWQHSPCGTKESTNNRERRPYACPKCEPQVAQLHREIQKGVKDALQPFVGVDWSKKSNRTALTEKLLQGLRDPHQEDATALPPIHLMVNKDLVNRHPVHGSNIKRLFLTEGSDEFEKNPQTMAPATFEGDSAENLVETVIGLIGLGCYEFAAEFGEIPKSVFVYAPDQGCFERNPSNVRLHLAIEISSTEPMRSRASTEAQFIAGLRGIIGSDPPNKGGTSYPYDFGQSLSKEPVLRHGQFTLKPVNLSWDLVKDYLPAYPGEPSVLLLRQQTPKQDESRTLNALRPDGTMGTWSPFPTEVEIGYNWKPATPRATVHLFPLEKLTVLAAGSHPDEFRFEKLSGVSGTLLEIVGSVSFQAQSSQMLITEVLCAVGSIRQAHYKVWQEHPAQILVSSEFIQDKDTGGVRVSMISSSKVRENGQYFTLGQFTKYVENVLGISHPTAKNPCGEIPSGTHEMAKQPPGEATLPPELEPQTLTLIKGRHTNWVALNWAYEYLRQGKKVMLFSPEQSNATLLDALQRVHGQQRLSGWKDLVTRVTPVSGDYSMGKVPSPQGVDAVFVLDASKMQPNSRLLPFSSLLQVDEILFDGKRFAREHNVPVVMAYDITPRVPWGIEGTPYPTRMEYFPDNVYIYRGGNYAHCRKRRAGKTLDIAIGAYLKDGTE